MKKKSKAIIVPIITAFVLIFAIATIAYVLSDAKMTGIRISTANDGIPVKLRLMDNGNDTPTDTLVLNMTDVTLKPCSFANGIFVNADGTNVTADENYVRSVSVLAVADENCTLYASKSVDGNLPIGVICQGYEVSEGTAVGETNSLIKQLTFYFYVDAEHYSEAGTSDVEITVHGE